MAHPDQEKKVLPVQLVATPAASIEPSVRPDKVTSELDRPPAPRPITVAHTETVERAPLQAPAVAPTSAILPPSPERPVTPDTPITAKEYTAPLPIHVLSEQPPKSPTEAPTIENEAPLARDAKVRDVPPPPPSFTPRPQQKVDMNVPTPAPLVQVSEIKKLTPTGLTSVEPELALFNAPTTTHHQPRPITTLPSTHAPQVAAQIASAVAQIGSGTTQILLNPEELGRVRLTLTTTEHGIAVSVAAERPETIDLMRRHVDLLVQEFDDLDQGSIDLQFQQNDSNSGKTDSNSNYSSAALEDDKTQIAPPTTILSATPSGGLDLKL